MKSLSFEVLGIIVPKGRHRATFKDGKRQNYPEQRTANYETKINLAAGKAMDGRKPLDGPISMAVYAYMPIPVSLSKRKRRMAIEGALLPVKRPDLDNFVKSALDGCNKVVFGDDSQVVLIRAAKVYSERPRLEIRVKVIER